MYLCAYSQSWPVAVTDAAPPATVPASFAAASLALDWSVIAGYVTHRDPSGRVLLDSMAGSGLRLFGVELSALTCLDTQSFDRQTDDAYIQMRIARQLGARQVIVSSAHDGSAGLDMTAAALKRLAALAERLELVLCVRNVNGSAVEQLDAIHQLFREVGSELLSLCLDNVEFQRAAVNPADAVLSFSGRIGSVRLRDERGGAPCPLGDGAAHVDVTLAALKEEGFDGALLVDPDRMSTALRRIGRYLR